MEQNERQVIDGLFDKLRQVDRQSKGRDPEAEAYIKSQLANLPAAPYYMAQALLIQEQALTTAQSRIQELEQQGSERGSGGGFLSGLFGGGSEPQRRAPAPRPQQPAYAPQQTGGYGSPWGGGSRMGMGGGMGGMGMGGGMGGGFLAGAATTALGVAGGMLAAQAISSAFSHGDAEAAGFTAPEPAGAEQSGFEPAADEQPADAQDAGYQEAAYEEPAFDDSSDMGDFGDDSV